MKQKLIGEYNRRNSMPNEGAKGQKAMKTINEERRPNTRTSSAITCYFCKKPNVIKKECRKYIEWKRKIQATRQRRWTNALRKVCTVTNMKAQLVMYVLECRWPIKIPHVTLTQALQHICAVTKNLYVDRRYTKGVALANGQTWATAWIGEDLYSALQVAMKSCEYNSRK